MNETIVKPRRYYLTISTWGGVVPSARHFYGRIRWRYPSGDRDDHAGRYVSYDLERLDFRRDFLKESSLVRFARAWFRKHRLTLRDVLLRGDPSTYDAKPVLEGPSDIASSVAPIVARFEVAYPPELNDALDWEAADAATEEWERFFESEGYL